MKKLKDIKEGEISILLEIVRKRINSDFLIKSYSLEKKENDDFFNIFLNINLEGIYDNKNFSFSINIKENENCYFDVFSDFNNKIKEKNMLSNIDISKYISVALVYMGYSHVIKNELV